MYVMALAPAWMVRRIDSSVGPPVAMMGTFGKSRRISATISGVAAAPETLRKSAPASRRLPMSRVSGDHRDDHGNVHHLFDLADDIVGGGGIQHHAVGTLVLGLGGSRTEREPVVIPPPTPTNTGTSDTLMMAWEITGWGVKG